MENRETAGHIGGADGANVADFPSIADVFARLASRELAGDDGRAERRDFCLAHDDQNTPSCAYNVERNVWHCHTCGANGGVIDLVTAKRGGDRAAARKWLREQDLLAASGGSWWARVSIIYSYTNADGIELYQVGRRQLPNGKKEFRQRRPRPDGNEGFINDLKGVVRVPYRLPELIAERERGGTIYVVEGEKDADRLRSLGLVATTNAQGAKWPWPEAWADYFKGAARVAVLGDNDEAGREAAKLRASICALAVSDTRLIAALPGVREHGDVSDWLDAGGTVADLGTLAEAAPVATAYRAAYPRHAVHRLVEDMTDTGNGRWFIDCVGSSVMWVPEYKTWLGWDGSRWNEEGVVIEKMIDDAVDKMRLAVRDYTGRSAEDFAKWSATARAQTKRDAMLKTARGQRFASIQRFDADRTLLNLANGTLDCATGALLPHDPELLLTKMSSLRYDPDAACPRWEAWIAEAQRNDAAMVDYVQQIMGGALVGRPGTRRMFFAYGPPGTGKSTLNAVMHALLGEYAVAVDFDVLATKGARGGSGPSPEIARLKGARLITAVESRDNDQLDAARLKAFVGGDLITARHMYKGVAQFPIEGTLFMSGNNRPTIDADDSLWSKLKLIPFEYEFPERDVRFFERVLAPELPGILNWAIAGLHRLIANDWNLADPDAVANATEEYRESEDRLGEFIESCCELWTPDSGQGKTDWYVPCVDMREAYRQWAESARIQRPYGDRTLARLVLRLRNVEPAKKHAGTRVYAGVRLRMEVANRLLQADREPPRTPPRSRDFESTEF